MPGNGWLALASLAMKREAWPSLPVFPQRYLLRSFPTFSFARALDSVGIDGLTDREIRRCTAALPLVVRNAPCCALCCAHARIGHTVGMLHARNAASWKEKRSANLFDGLHRRVGQLVWLGGTFTSTVGRQRPDKETKRANTYAAVNKQHVSNKDRRSKTNRT